MNCLEEQGFSVMKLREIGFLSTSKHSDRSEPGEGALDDMQS